MAVFCLKCWNKMNDTNESERKYILSKELDLCEECAQMTHVIIIERKAFYLRKFRFLVIFFKIIFFPFFLLWRILLLLHIIYLCKTQNKNDLKFH